MSTEPAYPPITVIRPRGDEEYDSPVYVYGASGREWKFQQVSHIRSYFNNIHWTGSPEYENLTALLTKYGPDIGKRLKIALAEPCYDPEYCDYQVEIRNPDGTLTQKEPRGATFHYRKSNIHITIPLNSESYRKYGSGIGPLVHLIEGSYQNIEDRLSAIKFAGRDDEQWELLRDYLLGDRVVYSEPQTRPKTYIPPFVEPEPPSPVEESVGCWDSLVSRRRRVAPAGQAYEFMPLHIKAS